VVISVLLRYRMALFYTLCHCLSTPKVICLDIKSYTLTGKM